MGTKCIYNKGAGTTLEADGPLFLDETETTEATQPVTSNQDGSFDIWFKAGHTYREIVFTHPDGSQYRTGRTPPAVGRSVERQSVENPYDDADLRQQIAALAERVEALERSLVGITAERDELREALELKGAAQGQFSDEFIRSQMLEGETFEQADERLLNEFRDLESRRPNVPDHLQERHTTLYKAFYDWKGG